MESFIIFLGWTFGFHKRWRICWTPDRLLVTQVVCCTKSRNELRDRLCVRIKTYSLLPLSRFYSWAEQWYLAYQREKELSTVFHCCFLTLDAVLLARSQYSEGPATGHLDTGFSWFPCVYKQMLRWFPRFQVATTCFSCSPPDLNLVVTNFMFCIHVK